MLFLPLFHTLFCCCFDSSSFTLKHLYFWFFLGFQEVWLWVVFWEWDWVRKLLFFFVCNHSPCPTCAKIVGYLLGTLSKGSGKFSFEICWAVVLRKSTFWPPVNFLPLTVTEVYPCNKYILHSKHRYAKHSCQLRMGVVPPEFNQHQEKLILIGNNTITPFWVGIL